MWCDVGLGWWGVGNLGIGYKGEGQGPGCHPWSPGLGFFNEKEASGGVGALGAFGAVSSFLRDVAWWPVRSDNPYNVFAHDLTKMGSAW